MNKLKELRKEKKLSQKELAENIGVHYRTLQNWENGESSIKPDKAQQLAKFFGVPVGYLLGYEEEKMQLQINYFHTEQPKLVQHKKGDWIDIPTPNAYNYKAGDTVFVKFGFSMKLPENHEAHIVPRSSTFKNYGLLLTNSTGIIDNSYCGDNDEWCAMFYATRDGKIEVEERLVQFRLFRNQPKLEILEVDSTGESDRGGYGSTGR